VYQDRSGSLGSLAFFETVIPFCDGRIVANNLARQFAESPFESGVADFIVACSDGFSRGIALGLYCAAI
jgi:hypothetical protein